MKKITIPEPNLNIIIDSVSQNVEDEIPLNTIDAFLSNTLNEIRKRLNDLHPESFINSLPSIPIESEDTWENLPPQISAVYFLTHPFEELLYIGKTNDIRARWKPGPASHHDCLIPAVSLGNVKLSWWQMDKELTLPVESVLIKLWNPVWNFRMAAWIDMYRPEWLWPDDVSEWIMQMSEKRRGDSNKRMEAFTKVFRMKHRNWVE